MRTVFIFTIEIRRMTDSNLILWNNHHSRLNLHTNRMVQLSFLIERSSEPYDKRIRKSFGIFSYDAVFSLEETIYSHFFHISPRMNPDHWPLNSPWIALSSCCDRWGIYHRYGRYVLFLQALYSLLKREKKNGDGRKKKLKNVTHKQINLK